MSEVITEQQIRASFKMVHDELSEDYYSGKSGMSKEEFDTRHAGNWQDLEAVLIAAGFLEPVVPGRDFANELELLEARVKRLEPLFFPEKSL